MFPGLGTLEQSPPAPQGLFASWGSAYNGGAKARQVHSSIPSTRSLSFDHGNGNALNSGIQ